MTSRSIKFILCILLPPTSLALILLYFLPHSDSVMTGAFGLKLGEWSRSDPLITGAFGLKLGEEYRGKSSKSGSFNYPQTVYKVTPSDPISLLDEYFVIKTKDNVIAQIVGAKFLGGCSEEYFKLVG